MSRIHEAYFQTIDTIIEHVAILGFDQEVTYSN
jgi:hypothetical protein